MSCMNLPPREAGQRWLIETSTARNAKVIVEVLPSKSCKILQVISHDNYNEYLVGKDICLGFNCDYWQYTLLENQEKPKG